MYPPFFILQETTDGKHKKYAHTRYIVLSTTPSRDSDPNRHYSWWRNRNLVQGTAQGMSIEVHIHLQDENPSPTRQKAISDLRKEIRAAGEGFSILSDHALRQVLLEDIRKPLAEWYPGLCSPTTASDMVQASTSNEIFLARKIEDPLEFMADCQLCVLDAYAKGLWDFSEEEVTEARADRDAARAAIEAQEGGEDNEVDNEDGNEVDTEADNADEMEVDGDEEGDNVNGSANTVPMAIRPRSTT